MKDKTQTADRNSTLADIYRAHEPAAGEDSSPESTVSQHGEDPLARANMLCDLGRYGDAVPLVGETISDDPRDPRAWCLMGRAQLGDDRPSHALEAARAASKLDPGSELPHRLASVALSRLGREQEAVTAARDAARCEPHSWRAQARLARALAASGDRLKEARAAAERAQALEPDDPEPHLAAGAVALAAGSQSDATAAFCTALSVDPQCGEAHNQLADLQAGKGESVGQKVKGALRPGRPVLPRLRLPRRRPHWG